MDENTNQNSPHQPVSPTSPRVEAGQGGPVSYARNNKSSSRFFDNFSSFFTKKTVAGLVILVLVIGVGATIIATQQSTEFRQRASTPTATLEAITKDYVTSAQSTVTLSNPRLTWQHTVGSGSNGILVVGVNIKAAPNTITSTNVRVTYKGTLLRYWGMSGNNDDTLNNMFFYLLNPPSGPNDVVVTLPVAGSISAGSSNWFNVDQTTPVSWFTSQDNTIQATNGTILSMDTAVGQNQILIDVIGVTTACNIQPGSAQATLIWNRTNGTFGGGQSYKDPGAPQTVTMNWDTSSCPAPATPPTPPCYVPASLGGGNGTTYGYGDVNNDHVVTAADATQVSRWTIGLDPGSLTPLKIEQADVNDTRGNVQSTTTDLTNSDAVKIARYETVPGTTLDVCAKLAPTTSWTYITGKLIPAQISSGGTIPAQPSGLTVGTKTCSNNTVTVNLSWNAVSGATYRVYKQNAGSWILVADNLTSTSFAWTGLPPSTTYNWTVTAFNSSGESSKTNASVFSTFGVCTPTAITCTDGTAASTCSTTKPGYCPATGGTVVNNCGGSAGSPTCGCPTGQTCNTTTGACTTPAGATPTPTPTSISFQAADINRDGTVDLIDFNLWLRAAQEIDSFPYSAGGNPYYPDVNNSGGIPDLLDFNMWLAAVPR